MVFLDSIINGLVFTVFSDMGPVPIVNMSSLDHGKILKLSILGMTLLSMGTQGIEDKLTQNLHGPIPVPDTNEFEALSMTFSVVAAETKDERIERFGRTTNLWIIFNSKYRSELFSHHSSIERFLSEEILSLKYESDLRNEERITKIFNGLKRITAPSEVTSPSTEVTLEPVEKREAIYFFAVNQQGEHVQANEEFINNPAEFPVVVIVNTIQKRIFVLKNREDATNRQMFLASRAASTINTKRFKNEFHIRDISDPFEAELLMDQISVIFDKL